MAALTVYGAYADWVCVPANEVVRVPEGLDAAEAVSLVLNYVTAYQLMHRAAQVRSGERMLVQGAAGGVGTAALELARLARVETFPTTYWYECSALSASAPGKPPPFGAVTLTCCSVASESNDR